MSTPATDTSIRTSVVVKAPIDRAFRVFTEDFDKVKPRSRGRGRLAALPAEIRGAGCQGRLKGA
jgi:hypothetical protein